MQQNFARESVAVFNRAAIPNATPFHLCFLFLSSLASPRSSVVVIAECVVGILLRNVGVPSFAVYGKEAVLTCDYDLEGQALYSVKWYKNGLEFYR